MLFSKASWKSQLPLVYHQLSNGIFNLFLNNDPVGLYLDDLPFMDADVCPLFDDVTFARGFFH